MMKEDKIIEFIDTRDISKLIKNKDVINELESSIFLL
jgi:hypothetical protein